MKRFFLILLFPVFCFGYSGTINCNYYNYNMTNIIGSWSMTGIGGGTMGSPSPSSWSTGSASNVYRTVSWSFQAYRETDHLPYYSVGSSSFWFSTYSAELWLNPVWIQGWIPESTNSPFSPTNLFFEVSGTFQNPYEFPVDLFYMFYDEDGNEVGSAFIHTVDGYENYGFSGTYRCLLNDEIDWLGSGFVWDSVGLDFKTVDGFSESNPDLVSIIDADSDGYFDAPYNGSWSWSAATNFYFGTYSTAQARSNTIAAAGSGAASRRVTNELDVAFTSPSPGVAGAVNTLSGSSADVIQTAAGVAAGLGLAGLGGGSGGGSDMSGVIGGLGTLGGKVDAVGGKVDDLGTLIEDTFNMGSVGDTTVVDPTEGLQDMSGMANMTGSMEGKHAGFMTFSRSLGNWFTWDFPTVSGRRYSYEFVVGRNWTVKFDLAPYSAVVELFRSVIAWFLAIVFIMWVFNITRKGIA